LEDSDRCKLTLLKCKLHRACVTHAEVDYEGPRDRRDLLRLAGIREYEQIQIYNVTNGERFTPTRSARSALARDLRQRRRGPQGIAR